MALTLAACKLLAFSIHTEVPLGAFCKFYNPIEAWIKVATKAAVKLFLLRQKRFSPVT